MRVCRQRQAVDSFAASGESSRDYLLDLEAGTVRFGNGVRGRAPQIGERIRVLEYQYGGVVAGHVVHVFVLGLA